MKARKMLIFSTPRVIFYNSMSLAASVSIDVNFHLQKSLEIFEKKSADKILSIKGKGVESALPHVN